MKMNKDKLNTTLTTLYVGDLHPDVTEPVLMEKFVPVGGVHSIKLYRDKATGFSRGYAYVNFYQRADAEKAFELLNYDLLMGQPMRIMWFQMDSSLRNAGTGNIFINNLDKSINSLELHGLFSTFGKILSCKIVGYKKGHKRYAYIHYESVDAAEMAIKALNGTLLNGRLVTIEHFKSFKERQAESAHCPQIFTNIFIKYFNQDIDTKKLTEIFSKFGPVASARVMTNEQGKSKRFGFVRYERPEDAQKAVDEMNGKEVNGRRIYVNRAQRKEQRQAELKRKYGQSLNLFVKNLEASVDDECLRKEFSRFGHIINAKVMMRNGHSRMFGFVHFSSSKDAINAINEMNGRMWGKKPLYVAVAQSKECQAYLAQQQMQWMAYMQFGVPGLLCYLRSQFQQLQS
ncbi:polyadenylate-binding protein 1-like [Clarias gariepinus]